MIQLKPICITRIIRSIKHFEYPNLDAHPFSGECIIEEIMQPIIAHIDMDSFFVSVERLLDPSLIGKPVVVGGDPESRGVVSCASYEARAYGIRSAMPASQAKRLCAEAIFVRGQHTEYGVYSEKVRSILEASVPVVEQASIDEFYLDIAGCERLCGHPLDYCKRLWQHVHDELGLPSSFGIAPNKSVAKIASKVAKPDGLKYVDPMKLTDFLYPLSVGILGGVGKVTLERLHQMNIQTVGQLAALDRKLLQRIFGKPGDELYLKARGLYQTSVKATHDPCKQISHETTFQEDVYDIQQLKDQLHLLIEKLGYRLRSKGRLASTITVKVRYSDFKTVSSSKSFEPTSADPLFYKKATELLERLVTRRTRIRLLGVGLGKLSDMDGQLALFSPEKSQRYPALFEAVDQLRKKYGYDIIYAGTFGKTGRRIQSTPPNFHDPKRWE